MRSVYVPPMHLKPMGANTWFASPLSVHVVLFNYSVTVSPTRGMHCHGLL